MGKLSGSQMECMLVSWDGVVIHLGVMCQWIKIFNTLPQLVWIPIPWAKLWSNALSKSQIWWSIFFIKGKISDGDFFADLFFWAICSLKETLYLKKTPYWKEKCVFSWKDLIVPVQISHPTQARFKFCKRQSNAYGLLRGGWFCFTFMCV